MSEYVHRARASKISLKDVASTQTFSLLIGKFRGQVSRVKCLLLIRSKTTARIGKLVTALSAGVLSC